MVLQWTAKSVVSCDGLVFVPMNRVVTGIDVGTYHVKVVIAEAADDVRQPPRILGTGYAESRGLKQGYIVSIPEVARSIAAAVAQASRAARVPVKRAYVGLSGVGLDEAFARGEAVVERGDSEITDRDIPRAIEASRKALPPAATLNREILHTIPLRFSVDGVGFLGAGAIMHNGTNHVIGLTTAAWIWFTSAVGILIGLDHGPVAIFVTLSLVTVINTARKIEVKYFSEKHKRRSSDKGDKKDHLKEVA